MMPKINVYLPDQLAASVRDAGIPVSAVCQAALTDAVQKVARVRWTTGALRDPATPAATFDRLAEGFAQRTTARLTAALDRAGTGADGAPRPVITSADLLAGLLGDENLAVRLLAAERVDVDALNAGAAGAESAILADEPHPEVETGPSVLGRMTLSARAACAAALDAVVELGHNYVGCEHLLVGLTDAPGTAHDLLAAAGVRPDALRRALTVALAGAVHATGQQTATLADLTRRLEAVERKLAEP